MKESSILCGVEEQKDKRHAEPNQNQKLQGIQVLGL